MGNKEDDKAAFLQSGRCNQVRLVREVEVHDNFSFGEDSSCDSHTDKSVGQRMSTLQQPAPKLNQKVLIKR